MSEDSKNNINNSDSPVKDEDQKSVDNTSGLNNTHLKKIIGENYIEYASYVIKERAIPEVRDGMKPVQRRILWSFYKTDDGKYHKVANIVGYCMRYHPHGDASIYEALVHLANKEFFIDKQGNFGNIITGDSAAAARYIEARLTPLAREVLFNPDISEFIDSYDGRNKEPVYFPAKVPVLLMIGQEGIAPGMTTSIFPHNFKELLEAQISILKNEDFEVYPDFYHGGIMDVSEYNDGNGKITLRARIDIEGRKLIIREIPAFTTTELLIASVEKAAEQNKIKISSIKDFTADKVEIEITPSKGYKPEKILKALYAYTDCSITETSSILVIKDNKPVRLTVSEYLNYSTDKLVEYLKTELNIELSKLNDSYHEKTLERIFIENRLYKRMEESKTYESVTSEIRKGLEEYKHLIKREISKEDIEKLLTIPIRKISRFDINKNKEEIEKIEEKIAEIKKHLNDLINYTINYLRYLIEQYAVNYPRNTEIEEFEKINKKEAAVINIKVGWDRKYCYVGSNVKSDDFIKCSEFDELICIYKTGKYKIINVPQKIYIGRLYHFAKFRKGVVFSIIYKEKKRGFYYVKKTAVNQYIKDKMYNLIPENCQLEFITNRENAVYECVTVTKSNKQDTIQVNFSEIPFRKPGAKGLKLTEKKIKEIRFLKKADESDEEETNNIETETDDNNNDSANSGSSADNTVSENNKENVHTDKDENRQEESEKIQETNNKQSENENPEQKNTTKENTGNSDNSEKDNSESVNENKEEKSDDSSDIESNKTKNNSSDNEEKSDKKNDSNDKDEDLGIDRIQPYLGF